MRGFRIQRATALDGALDGTLRRLRHPLFDAAPTEERMTWIDRRSFIITNAVTFGALALSPHRARGLAPSAPPHAPGSGPAAGATRPGSNFYRFTLGDAQLTALSDGWFTLPGSLPDMDVSPHEFLALNETPTTRESYFRSRLVPEDDLPLPANPVVVDSGGRRVLVDAGWAGETAPATAGRLQDTMEAAGITRASVDVVVLTHGHPDHLGGLADLTTGQPTFPNAEVVMSDVEHELWTAPGAADRFRDVPLPLPMIQGVLRVLDDRIRTVRAGDDVVPRITSVATPGHTEGHMSLIVDGGGGAGLLLTGDAISTIHTQIERPQWLSMFDHDAERAAATRQMLLDRATSDQLGVMGYHFPFPGLGRVIRDGGRYRWLPAGSADVATW
jgi:glyoxylase-like metal-dependent hydrolase (beta-lactamase superfamily II)